MHNHPVGLDVWFFVWPFVYFYTSCVQTAKALARLLGCAGSPEPSLDIYVLSTIISWAGSNYLFTYRPEHMPNDYKNLSGLWGAELNSIMRVTVNNLASRGLQLVKSPLDMPMIKETLGVIKAYFEDLKFYVSYIGPPRVLGNWGIYFRGKKKRSKLQGIWETKKEIIEEMHRKSHNHKWVASWQNQQNDCASIEDSDQPGHPPSLIRVFAVHMKKAWVLRYPLSAQRRLWSDWVDAQADLSLCWAHTHFVGFVTSRLKS